MIEPITVDFETEGIDGNPLVQAPKPVGMAVWVPGQEPVYLAWGHPEFAEGDPRWPEGSTNNCTWEEAHNYLIRLRDSGRPLLFHNAPFDLSVWNQNFVNALMGLKMNWRRFHDTMYLLFLADPYSTSFSLKPSADRYLGVSPDEQTELHNWIVKHVPEATRKTAGAFICRAPADLVGRYAIGDVVRTRKLFDLLYPQIVDQGMEPAYDRERHLMPALVDGTRRGIRIDRHTLEHHESVYSRALDIADDRVRKIISYSGPVGSDEGFAQALHRVGAIKELVYTKTGKISMAQENLVITDPELKKLYEYRAALSTCLSTFIRPWLEKSAGDGRLHPNWNQVRQARGASWKDSKGTRTGRLSSDDPNFQNVPNEFTYADGSPLLIPEGLVPLPIMRRYCLPEEGHIWLKRDYSSQEIRILAHFEDGTLCEAYRGNPDLDPHEMARQLVYGIINVLFARKSIKITGFSLIYGTGYKGLSLQLNQPLEEAIRIKDAYLAAMPAIRDLMADVQARGRAGQPIVTWGGRVYYSEPSKVIDGRLRDFHYKLLNYLIQGSAADQTKDTICEWDDTRRWDVLFLATVHDEINISSPREYAITAMQHLRECMEADRFDVPFRSEGYFGNNWADLEETDKGGLTEIRIAA